MNAPRVTAPAPAERRSTVKPWPPGRERRLSLLRRQQPVDTRMLRPSHKLTLLKGGSEFFASLVEAVDNARAEVLLETYILEFAGAVLPVAEALERAAARGVVVRVVVDAFGTPTIPPEWQTRWRAAGLQWRSFNDARGWRMLMPRKWRRLHRKLCVVDGWIAFCGGINLLDDYVDPNHGALAEPRLDFSVRVIGPLVDDVHETMTRLWLRVEAARDARRHDVRAALRSVRAAVRAGADFTDPEMLEHFPPEVDDDERGPGPRGAGAAGKLAGLGSTAALVLRDNVRYRRRIERTYRFAINQAKTEILIANAYFVPGVKLQRALLRARKRGVHITLLLQGRYEYFMQHHTTRALYGVLLNHGIEIVEYKASFLHAKVAVFDGTHGAIATVGSSNLEPLSLLLAREANIFARDEAFVAALREHLMNSIANEGQRVESRSHLGRPWAARVLSWLAYGMMRFALFMTGNRY